MYSQSGINDFGRINLKKITSKIPSSIKDIFKVAGTTAGITALTNFFIKKGLSPDEAQAAARRLVVGREREIITAPEESFFEKKIFGIPMPFILGGGALLTILLLLRR